MSVPRDERLSAGRIASHLVVMVSVAALLGVVVAGLAIPFAGVMGVGARNVAKTMDSLPAELETKSLPQRTRLLDSDGDTIATFYDENRVNVSLDQISRTMIQAIVSIEDSRFYQHGALDMKGTVRALVTNQANDGVVQGGSSITQQMVKLTLQTQAKTKAERAAATESTYARKLRELRYAIAMEQRHSKDWILERYLNIAYFGDGTYGVQSAARHYFGVNAKKLSLPQAAMLAGLVKNPTGYDPTNSPDRALQRRNVVLDRMASLNVITREQADETKKLRLGLHVVTAKNGCWFSRAPFFCDYAWNYLLDDPALGETVAQRRQLLKSGGLTIRSTIDLKDQEAAEKAVTDHVARRDQAVGAIAMVEPRTGNVKAVAQSRPMGRSEKKGETFLNYAVPTKYGDSAGFQAGSTFKPFVLAAALEEGIPLSTTFNAPRTLNIDTAEFANCPNEPGFVGNWKVSSSTIDGSMNIYVGTQKSVNTFYAMLERATGVCKPFKIAQALGVQLTYAKGDGTHLPERVPTFTLGIANASPLEMAEAYATFAGRGLHCDSRPVTSIQDSSGKVLKKYRPSCQQALPETTADAVNDVLRGVQEPGGFGYQQGTGLNVPSAAKTGTTQDGKSVWYVGYTPQLASAAMIAGASKNGGKPIELTGQTIHGDYVWEVSGSGFAGPMWAEAMQAVQSRLDPVDFVQPTSANVHGIPTTVPSVSGMSIDSAESTLRQAGFNPIRGGATASGYPQGTVARTDPSGGSTIPKGSAVTIYQSTGVPPPRADDGKGKGKGKGKPRGGRGGRGGR
jgi:membrane peptidoglycan carboxypeptidase